MDIIFLHDMSIETIIGVEPWERIHPQKLLLDLDVALDSKEAGISDQVADTINYAQLCSDVREHVKTLKYQLIEALAEDIATFVLNHYPTSYVLVCLKKPGILSNVAQVGVRIERGEKNQ